MKWLIKLICPSGKTLAGYAAEGIAKDVDDATAEGLLAKCVKEVA